MPLRRLAALCTLLLHVLVAGVLPCADARDEATTRSAEARVHVEATGTLHARALHDELTCQLCTVLRAPGLAGAPRVELPAVERGAARPAVARELAAVDREAASPGRARAPPVA